MLYSDQRIKQCSPKLQALLWQQDRIKNAERGSLALGPVLAKIIRLAKEEKLCYIYVRSMYEMVYFQNVFNEPRKAVQYAEIFLREGPSIFEETLPNECNPTLCRHTYSYFFELIGDIYTKFYQISSEKMEQFFALYREVVRNNGSERSFYECRLEWELMCLNEAAVKKACRHYETLPIGNLCYVCTTRVVCKSRVLLGDLDGALNYVDNIISGNIPSEANGYDNCRDTSAYDQYIRLFQNCLECGKIDLLDRVLPLVYKAILADEENKNFDYCAALVYALYGNFERWGDRVKDACTYIDELKLYKPYTNMHHSLAWMTYFTLLYRSGVTTIAFPTENPITLEADSAGLYSVSEIADYFEQIADEIGWKFEKSRVNFAYAKRKRCFRFLEEIHFCP